MSVFTSRRSLLVGVPATLAAAGLGHYARPLYANPNHAPHRFISLYFNGAWDVLIGLDPRDPSSNPSGIDLGYNRLAPEFREPTPWTFGGQETLIGPTMDDLFDHRDVMTIFRGVNMNTVAHPTGRAYVNTFIPPAGVVPKGDSLATRMAAGANYDDFLLPNVSIGVPSFNLSFAPAVTGIGMGRATDATNLVEPLGDTLDTETAALLRAAREASGSCVGAGYSDPPAARVDIARDRVEALLGMDLGPAFDFSADEDLQARYGIENANSSAEPGVIAATIWRLMDLGLTTSVTAQFQRSLDTHDVRWEVDQPELQRQAFRALAALLADLRSTDPSLANTTVIVHSEFARTPNINGRGGRDHWFANSILVFGGGLRPGVFGATLPETLGLTAVDLETGLPSESGEVIRPEHVGATLAHARGLETDEFRVEPLTNWIA